jgi:hypothetical protein
MVTKSIGAHDCIYTRQYRCGQVVLWRVQSWGGWDWVHLVCRPLFAPLYQSQMTDDECEAVGGMRIGRGNRSTRRKPAPMPLCPPQISHDMTWARTRVAAVGTRHLTAWAMARPYDWYRPILYVMFFWILGAKYSDSSFVAAIHHRRNIVDATVRVSWCHYRRGKQSLDGVRVHAIRWSGRSSAKK